MIIVRNSQLNLETVESLNLLLDLKLPTKSAFKLVKMIKEVSSLIDDKLKLEKKILDRNVERDQTGNFVVGTDQMGNPIPNTFKIKNMEEFNAEMEELNSFENELPFDKLDIDDLDIDSISVRDLMKIEFIFNS
jgi:hypothetical protein